MGFENNTKKLNDTKNSSFANDLFSTNDNKMKGSEFDEDGTDVTFGAYVPSTARSQSTSASKRRNVKFEEDFLTQPNNKLEREDSFSKSLKAPTKSNYDWLGISTDSDNVPISKNASFDSNDWLNPGKKEEFHTPEVQKVKFEKPSSQSIEKNENWLGFSDSPSQYNQFDVDKKPDKKPLFQNEKRDSITDIKEETKKQITSSNEMDTLFSNRRNSNNFEKPIQDIFQTSNTIEKTTYTNQVPSWLETPKSVEVVDNDNRVTKKPPAKIEVHLQFDWAELSYKSFNFLKYF
jgi:hypothetical protein